MKKLALPLAALAIAIAAYGLSAPNAAHAQAQPRVAWEYRVFPLDPGDYLSKEDYKRIRDSEGPRKVDAAFKQHVLNYLGKDGWELVDLEFRKQNLVYFYLKRRAA